MANNIKQNIEYVGLNYQKEITKIVLINIVLIIGIAALYFFYRIVAVIALAAVVYLVINYLLLSSYSARRRQIDKDHDEELVYIISCFRIFISNKNNVYQSFNKLIDYSSPWMKEQLETLLKMIDDDKSIKPFSDFAERFNIPIARNIFASIYQMVEQGETIEQLNQFTLLFEQMNQALTEEKKERKNKSFDIVSFFPIIGAGIVTISLTFGMLSIVEEMLNVI